MPLLGRDAAGQLEVFGRTWWRLVPGHASLGRIRRRAAELVRWDRFSRPALDNLDAKLAQYLPERPGIFVEAGAHDGYLQSNTYYLERMKGWKGVLVEPIPELYARCVKERLGSRVFNCALVSEDYSDATVDMEFGDLYSVVSGSGRVGPAAADEHIAASGAARYVVRVPARTLSSVLDEAGVDAIDFLSLDVEGYELEVLKGLDLERHRPRYMLIEMLDAAYSRSRVEAMIAHRYDLLAELTPRDFLFALRD